MDSAASKVTNPNTNLGNFARYGVSLSSFWAQTLLSSHLHSYTQCNKCPSSSTMAVSTMLSITGTGAGNPFIGEFRPLGLFESKFYERLRKPYGSSCMNGHHFPRHKCIWRLPSYRNLNSKSKDSSLVLATGKEVKDSFIIIILLVLLSFSSFWFSLVWFSLWNMKENELVVADSVLYCFKFKYMEGQLS